MYTKILVPLDGSRLAEQILPYACLIAEAFGIPVELLRVNEPGAMTPFAPPLQGDEYLTAIADWAFPASLSVHRSIEVAKPAETILQYAGADRGAAPAAARGARGGHRRAACLPA